ncbi:MAG: nuclear transport factor 2 family protein [Pseudomonadales bacterium]|nr:nuclear transport factor 2 family protein [Pseudomonadales bacterium]
MATASDVNTALVSRLYEAFKKLDAETMASCYHPEAQFEDEVFRLTGTDIADMWRMLCAQATGFELHYSNVECDEITGSAHWEPSYDFSVTGRRVHNVIDAEFEFKDGLIYRHRDRFSFWRWSRQALGLPGVLFGWSGLIRNKVKQTANGNLRRFIEKSRRK